MGLIPIDAEVSGELSPSGRLHDVERKMFAHGDVFIRGDINLQ